MQTLTLKPPESSRERAVGTTSFRVSDLGFLGLGFRV